TTLIQGSNLALTAGTGIGSADDLNLAVANLAATNATSGAINILNSVALTIAATPIDGVSGVTNVGTAPITLNSSNSVALAPAAVVQSGNAAAGGTITIQSNVGNLLGTANVTFG